MLDDYVTIGGVKIHSERLREAGWVPAPKPQILQIRVYPDGHKWAAFFENSPDGNGRIQWGHTEEEALTALMARLRKYPFGTAKNSMLPN